MTADYSILRLCFSLVDFRQPSLVSLLLRRTLYKLWSLVIFQIGGLIRKHVEIVRPRYRRKTACLTKAEHNRVQLKHQNKNPKSFTNAKSNSLPLVNMEGFDDNENIPSPVQESWPNANPDLNIFQELLDLQDIPVLPPSQDPVSPRALLPPSPPPGDEITSAALGTLSSTAPFLGYTQPPEPMGPYSNLFSASCASQPVLTLIAPPHSQVLPTLTPSQPLNLIMTPFVLCWNYGSFPSLCGEIMTQQGLFNGWNNTSLAMASDPEMNEGVIFPQAGMYPASDISYQEAMPPAFSLPSHSPASQTIMDSESQETSRQSKTRSRAKRKRTFQPIQHCNWPGCGKDFRLPNELTKHMRNHTKPVTCTSSGCNYAAAQPRYMDRHVVARHPELAKKRGLRTFWDCTVCRKRFKREDNMLKHRREKHDNTFSDN